MRGVDQSQLARLSAPAGPDAGAKTPGEIALVAIVGVLALLRGRGRLSAIPEARSGAADLPLLAPQQRSSDPEVDAAMPGTKFINPVCGIAVDTVAPKHIEKYEGVVYYFCCDGCWTTFRQDPAKYAEIHRGSTGPFL